MHRALTAHTPLGETWWAVSLEGTEALSELYEFRLELKSTVSDIDVQSLIGEVAAVELEAQDGTKRFFSGQMIKAAAENQIGKYWHYVVTIAPKVWHASRRSDFKIWQNVTVQDIGTEILAKNAVRYEWRLKNQYKTWEYLVQYGETDLSFLLRRFEEEGVYFWFEHAIDGETLILADHFSTHETFEGYEDIPYYPPDRARADEDQFFTWSAARIPEPGHFQHSDFDFKHPSKDLTTTDNDPRGHLFDQYEIYKYPGNYVQTADGSSYAAVRLDELQQRQDTIELEGRVRGVIPGFRFKLTNHPREEQNRELITVRANYVITNDDYEGATDSQDSHYQVKIEAIPADVQFHAEQATEKPRTYGPETAVVVGPPGSEIHTDQYGRVKVHFHWDRYGQKDGADSTWIRVSYPWAGANYGAIHIPRVGQEVIVDYEYGDPDRPIIIGRVYNGDQMPPWDLPANKTQSGTLTRSKLGGTADNANAFRFEDAMGQEQIWLHAERNYDVEVELDQTVTIGRDQTITVGRDRYKTVCQDETVFIGRNRSATIGNDEAINIGHDQAIEIGNNKAETIGTAYLQKVGVGRVEMVGAAYNLNVGAGFIGNYGAAYNINIGGGYIANIGLGHIENVGGLYDLNIGGAYLTKVGLIYKLDVVGAHNTNVGAAMVTDVGGAMETNIGAGEIRIVGGAYLLDVGGNAKLIMDGAMIALQIGGSMIAMTSSQIIIQSGTILLNGISWDDHVHGGIMPGGCDTGPPH